MELDAFWRFLDGVTIMTAFIIMVGAAYDNWLQFTLRSRLHTIGLIVILAGLTGFNLVGIVHSEVISIWSFIVTGGALLIIVSSLVTERLWLIGERDPDER